MEIAENVEKCGDDHIFDIRTFEKLYFMQFKINTVRVCNDECENIVSTL